MRFFICPVFISNVLDVYGFKINGRAVGSNRQMVELILLEHITFLCELFFYSRALKFGSFVSLYILEASTPVENLNIVRIWSIFDEKGAFEHPPSSYFEFFLYEYEYLYRKNLILIRRILCYI